jgi:hypothetical protein
LLSVFSPYVTGTQSPRAGQRNGRRSDEEGRKRNSAMPFHCKEVYTEQPGYQVIQEQDKGKSQQLGKVVAPQRKGEQKDHGV